MASNLIRRIETVHTHMSQILIIVGTQSGNAAMVADVLQDRLKKKCFDVALLAEDTSELNDVSLGQIVLVCCSTHGDGELPDNLRPLYENMLHSKPDLTGLLYGVVALGDCTYADTYCYGGKVMDELLESLGAKKIGTRMEIDASTQPFPDEAAAAWLNDWMPLIAQVDHAAFSNKAQR